MKRYTKKLFGYATGIGLVIASPKITNYLLQAYTYFGGNTDIPFLNENQSLEVIKYGLEALVVYMGIKLIADA